MVELKSNSADMFRTGVYVITNTRNEKKYVGSAAATFQQRWKAHRVALRKGNHHSKHLQRAWDRDGEKSFRFQIVAFCDPNKCVVIEQLWINSLRTADRNHGYNISPTAGNQRGIKRSEETRKRMSEAQKGRKLSDERKRQMSEYMIGHKRSRESCEKQSQTTRGRPGKKPSEETRRKLSVSHMGHKQSPETIEKRVSKLRGRKRGALSQNVRDRISKSLIGRKRSPEAIAKWKATMMAKNKTSDGECSQVPIIVIDSM